MATLTFHAMGLRASLFADTKRFGLELVMRRSSRPEPGAVPVVADKPAAASETQSQVNAMTWYHTLDLGDGVITPGFYDHRPILAHYRLPARLDGMRVLDIATFDGFWAYEFERRGAAEVVALDINSARELDLAPRVRSAMSDQDLDRPFGAGFAYAHARLGSRVRRVHCNVYDAIPANLGQFDLVHCGDLLLHLRDPALALSRIRDLTRGEALISDCVFPDLDRHDGASIAQYDGGVSENIWWRFGAIALERMIRDAGFDAVEERARFRYGPRGAPPSMWHAVYRAAP